MHASILALTALALIGSAVIGGVFLAFSNFIMKALAQRPHPEGMAAMQAINVTVLNPLFLGTFAGTAVVCLLLVVFDLVGRPFPGWEFRIAGAVLYVVGTFLVTGTQNVPLNNKLAPLATDDPEAAGVWQHYLERWTVWNHVRTVAATAAAVCYAVGLVGISSL